MSSHHVATCRKWLFVGYVDERNEYRFVDPCRNEVVVSRDVRINENSDMNWNNYWFEVEKSVDLQGEVQKFEQSSCDVV